MSPTWKHIYIVAALLLAVVGLYIWNHRPGETHYHTHKVDSVRVIQIPVYSPAVNTQPIQVIVQQKTEPQARKEAEKQDIMTGVTISPGEVDIQSIDTAGHRKEEKYKIDPESTAIITNKGVEEKKKTRAGKIIQKTGKVVKTGLAVAGVIAILSFLSKIGI